MSIVSLHHRSLAVATPVVLRAAAADLALPTPCAGWDLRALLCHMVGQNHGFAGAVTSGDAPASAYAPRPPEGWTDSAEALSAAFAAADPAQPVRLVEISAEQPVTVEQAAGIQLLDTVVHTWDVATALGEPFRPDDELLAVTAAIAERIPTGPSRTAPGAAFAPARPPDGVDAWTSNLARLGRA